jgi:excisionase family DNA binding protein
MADKPVPERANEEKRAFRINEAVAAYGLSRTTIYKLIAERKLRAAKIGGRRLIPRDALETLLKDSTQ